MTVIPIVLCIYILPFSGSGQQVARHYTMKDGLSVPVPTSLLQDSRGFLWIGTWSGLNKFDGYSFKTYRENPGDSNSLSHNMIQCLWEDKQQRIWIGTQNGLDLFDLKSEKITRLILDPLVPEIGVLKIRERRDGMVWICTGKGLFLADPGSLAVSRPFDISRVAWDIGETKDGSIWVSIDSALLQVEESTGRIIRHLYEQNNPHSQESEIHKTLYIDNADRIWLGSELGIEQFYPVDKTFTYYSPDVTRPNLRVDVGAISGMPDGKFMVGSGFGLDVFDPETGDFKHLRDQMVWSLLYDRQGKFWVGAVDGLLQMGLTKKFNFINRFDSADVLDVRVYTEDKESNIWIGALSNNTNRLFSFNPYSRDFTQYIHDPKNPASYSGNLVRDAVPGTDGGVWLASVFNLEKYNRQTGTFFLHTILPFYPTRLFIDSRNTLWIGGWQEVGTFDLNTRNFEHLNNFPGADVHSITEDRQQNVWIGTLNGLYKYNLRSSQFEAYKNDPDDNQSLPHNRVNHVMVDQAGTVWLGTSRGLNKIITDPDMGTEFISWNTSNSDIPHDEVWCVIDGLDGTLWMTCANKITHFFPEKGVFRNYDHHDGLPGVVLKGLKSQTGEIYLSSREGLVVFHPDSLRDNEYIPPIVITGFSINNQDVTIMDTSSWKSPLTTSITYAETIELSYEQRDFSFEFSALNYISPENNRYKYKLEPYEQDWIETSANNRTARYTNISPGKYQFTVIGSNNDGIWNEQGQTVEIIIKPPLWATWWAYGLYGWCALGLVLALRHYEKKRFILKQQARSLREIDEAKSEFFTNISHELRTPLTLILGPLKALQDGTYKGDRESLFTIMSQNGRRLLQLVNQLLDLSKLDRGKLKLELQDCHINEWIKQVMANFDSACSLKNIELEFQDYDHPIYCRVDLEKIRQVLYNLMSNAIKFTPEGGQIQVSVNTVEQQQKYRDGQMGLKIVVRDSGIGIPKEEQQYIFDRFYQVKNAHQHETEGTGIGLALALKLVQLHKGTIDVKSEPGWGSAFTVSLPLIPAVPARTALFPGNVHHSDFSIFEPDIIEAFHTHTHTQSHYKPTLLIAEDNAQMRQYIRTCLGEDYQYLEAGNGKEGLSLAGEKLPDLILCDVMMPKMDGYEFCQNVRRHDATAHIPFIFLTAKADSDSHLKGLKMGSNDYIIKPFEAEELRLKVRNHLDRMQQFRSFFSKQLAILGEIDLVQSLDDTFLKKAINTVEDRMDNHEFSVQEFALQTGMSQAQLYRKLMAMTGQSPSTFIRSIRLKKAAQMIVQDYGNTSEVAYAVGFNNLSYFAKCFKEQFGVSPSGYGKKGIRS